MPSVESVRSCVVIPARYASSRFPGKPLAEIYGKPMILWVAELCASAVGKRHVYVATDNSSIKDVVVSSGFNALMTSEDCLTGTDRVCEAAKGLDYDIIVNVQGDEPVLNPQDILKCIQIKKKNMTSVVNGYVPIQESEDPCNVNLPKVIFNESQQLVYMSRNPLPGFLSNAPSTYYKQVCIYGYSHHDLNVFSSLGRKSTLESSEDIEILRFLEFKNPVIMYECSAGSLAVDVPSDIATIEKYLSSKK